ncbi:phage tail tape measure protein [Ochrobactrum intermedium]|uniref:tape measure protein n=1 Tax=Brucella intermedia TaxID=94625 RepID=UPI00128E31EB|nr:tape measure protein [Brucella intermedia]MPR62766.1 phage tail tape measure protein [Brucella intermedia]
MATDLETLVVQLSADFKSFERSMARANGITNRQFNAIEKRARQMNKNLDAIFARSFSGLVAPLGGIGAALGTREILRYADAWTSAKNSLAVAGVVGDEQKKVLDQLYQSAQANAAPITALTDLYGKAAQASDNLGASQADMLKFSDGVAVALRVAGTSASQASGALTQLGQLLGQARVQAEEFNSVNEGARPILMAVANGLDAAGGSVSKLKTLVTDGKVSGQQFFQAFLKGLPTIQAMAANATQTIEQGITKVNNAFTKYIGETDESLSASQRLVQALNSLADNFDHTADMVLKVAGIIAGALVGRSIVGMVRSLGLATSALWAFVGALRAASSAGALLTALGGIGAVAGPVGLVVGGAVVTALTLFASSASSATDGAQTYAAALKAVKDAAEKVPEAVGAATQAIDEKTKGQTANALVLARQDIEDTTAAVVELFDHLERNADTSAVSQEQLKELADIRKAFEDGTASAEDTRNALWRLANANPDFKAVANAFDPLLTKIREAIGAIDVLDARLKQMNSSGPSFRELEDQSMEAYREMKKVGDDFIKDAQKRNSLTKDQLALENEIAKVRKDAEKAGAVLTDGQIKELAQANLAADKRRSDEGKKPKKEKAVKKSTDQMIDSDIQAVRDRIAAMQLETEIVGKSYQEQEKRRMSLDLEQQALAKLRDEAIKKGQTDLSNITISAEQRAKIDEISEAYARQAEELRKVQDQQDRAEQAADEFYNTFRSSMSGAIRGAESFSDALANILDKLSDMLLNAAFDALFKPSSNGVGGGLFGGIFNNIGSLIPGFAKGTNNAPRGLAVVGENGPELVRFNGGEQVIPNHKLKAPTLPNLRGAASSGGGNFTYAPQIDARGADQAGLAQLTAELQRQKAELPATVLATMRKAKSTRNWRGG